MQRADFHFDLPDELIARYPSDRRSDCRLLCVEGASGRLSHQRFPDLLDRLAPGDLVVFNDTRVIPARLFGHKESGGRVEMLLERPLEAHRALAHLRASRAPAVGARLAFEGGITARVADRRDALFELVFEGDTPLIALLEAHGHMPLPPYIERADDPRDRERYQTVYARRDGAVAAPTAGLHFDEPMMDEMTRRGIEKAFVTLHVGAGTFQPVRVDNIAEHVMHSEWIEVSEAVAQQVRQTRARGNRVVAVGTTSVRCLESAAAGGDIRAFSGDTAIFIHPGYEWRCVDALVTNFHLPESTLLMLVAAFAGHRNVLEAYRAAVEAGYAFFSYGDAMYLTRRPGSP